MRCIKDKDGEQQKSGRRVLDSDPCAFALGCVLLRRKAKTFKTKKKMIFRRNGQTMYESINLVAFHSP